MFCDFSTFAVVMFGGMSQVPICLPHPKSEDRKNCVQKYGYPKWMVYNGKSMKILLKWMIWGYHYFLETPIDIHTLNMTSSHTVNMLRFICPCIYFYYDSYSFVVQIINKNWIQYEPMFVHRHGAVSSMWMFPKIEIGVPKMDGL